MQPQHEAAARGSFGDFLQHHLDDYAGLGRVICDYQVFHLSAGSFRASANGGHDVIDADLLEAKRGLKSWGYVGLVENFGQSLQRYANTYSRFFTKLTLEPSHQNWSETSNLAVNEALAVLEESLDPHIIQRFVQHNQRDYELYRWASNTFHA